VLSEKLQFSSSYGSATFLQISLVAHRKEGSLGEMRNTAILLKYSPRYLWYFRNDQWGTVDTFLACEFVTDTCRNKLGKNTFQL